MSSDQITSEITPLTREQARERRKLTITIGLILSFLVVSFYAVTIVRLKDNVAKSLEMRSGQTISKEDQKPAVSIDAKKDQ